MKLWVLLIAALVCSSAYAEEPQLKDIYGGVFTGCTVAADIDEGDQDVIGPLTANKLYTVFCYDSSNFTGVACRVKQGGSTVNAHTGEGSDGEGELLFAGEKAAVWTSATHNYISFEPVADGTTQVGVACRRN